MSLFHKHFWKIIGAVNMETTNGSGGCRLWTSIVSRCVKCGHVRQYEIQGNHASAIRRIMDQHDNK